MRVLTVPALLEQLRLEAGVVVVHDDASTVVATEPAHARVAHGPDAFPSPDATERRRGWCARPRALFLALHGPTPSPHAALLTFGPEAPYCPAVVSASPELFLARRGDRVTTRPIKGTNADAATLLGSAKDRAEHVMIVDLARND